MREHKKVTVFLGLGANLGDATASFLSVVTTINASVTINFVRASSIYRSRPWGGGELDLSDQGDYLNQVIEIETSMPATDLLEFTRALELLAGREPSNERWSARPLDIDILFYGNQLISLPELQIPHPRVHERAFVMLPLIELEIDLNILDPDNCAKPENQLCSSQQLEKDDLATERYNSQLEILKDQ